MKCRAPEEDAGSGYSCVLAFDTNDTEFVRGWECGQLFSRLQGLPETWGGTYHASNREMLRRIAESRQYSVEIEETEDPAWVFATFVRITKQPRSA
jgi:hypothetical protein